MGLECVRDIIYTQDENGGGVFCRAGKGERLVRTESLSAQEGESPGPAARASLADAPGLRPSLRSGPLSPTPPQYRLYI